MTIRLELPKVTELKPRITVIGVGGAGGNAVNNMIASGLTGVEFIVANTDAQALAASSAELRIQLGANLTEGLGAGSKPEIGQAAAEEAVDDIRSQISGSHMVFIAAGMGGGTGTGAAAVIARIAKELDILVVAIVTKPFQFEGARRMRMAETGIAELKRTVDTMIVIPNQNLFRVATERTTFAEAFVLADQVLYSGIACIVDLIVKEGLINLDFADVRTVLQGMGSAVMGTGEASGERRAVMAAEEAICNPLLDDVSLKGARGLLLSIIGGKNLTLYEVDEAASRVRMEVDPEANIIVGATFDESLQDRVRVSIVASGMDHQMYGQMPRDNGQREISHRDAAPPAAAAPQWAPQAPQPPSQLKQQPYYHHTAPAPAQAGPTAEPHGAIAPQTAPSRNLTEPRSQPPKPPQPAQQSLRAPSQREADDYARAMTDAYPQQQPLQYAGSQQGPHGQRHDAVPARDAWESPNGVTIEEALAPLAVPVAPPPLPHVPRPEQNAAEPGFTPQAPNDVRRPGRRMPELTDFPEIAQRDYRAKAPAPQSGDRGPAAPAKTPAPDTAARRKQGLFERLSSFGRRESDDDNLPMSYPPIRQDTAEPRRELTAQSTKVLPPQPGERPTQRGRHAADFPGFFDKKAR